VRDSFCKTGDRKAGMADSGAEWGRKVVLAWTSWEPGLDTGSAGETWGPGNWIVPRTSAEPGLDTGSAGETWGAWKLDRTADIRGTGTWCSSAAETWMDIVLFDLPKPGITL